MKKLNSTLTQIRPIQNFSKFRFINLKKNPTTIHLFHTSSVAFFNSIEPCISQTKPNSKYDFNLNYQTYSIYKFQSISESKLPKLKLQLESTLNSIDVLGRLYISVQGVNFQLSCPEKNLTLLKRFLCNQDKTKELLPFDIEECEFNQKPLPTDEKDAKGGEANFKKLQVKIKRQLVAYDYDIDIDSIVSNPPVYLPPMEWHRQLKAKLETQEKLVLFDVRNQYESEVGHFVQAYKPKVSTFKDNLNDLIQRTTDLSKDTPIYMYCTGGIRCSLSGSVLKSLGHTQVHMLKGGITNYNNFLKTNNLKKESLFKGSNFTFDLDLGEKVTEDILTVCSQCKMKSDRYTNCKNLVCNLLFVQCERCSLKLNNRCGGCEEDGVVLDKKENFERRRGIHNHDQRVGLKKVDRSRVVL